MEKLLETYQLDGVDYNWEYPEYRMGKGYSDEEGVGEHGLAGEGHGTRCLPGRGGGSSTPPPVSMLYFKQKLV